MSVPMRRGRGNGKGFIIGCAEVGGRVDEGRIGLVRF